MYFRYIQNSPIHFPNILPANNNNNDNDFDFRHLIFLTLFYNQSEEDRSEF